MVRYGLQQRFESKVVMEFNRGDFFGNHGLQQRFESEIFMIMTLKREKFRLRTMAKFASGAKSVLDVGLYFPNVYLREFSPQAKIVGLDIVKVDLPAGYDKVVVGDINNIDKIFSENSLDAILMGELIEHIESPYETLRKCRQVLRKGGKIILSTPNPLSFPRIIFELFNSKKYFYHKNHVFMYLPRWLTRMVQSCGFEIVAQSGVAFMLPMKMPYMLADQMIIVAQKKGNFKNQ